ncbi:MULTISPECIES: LCP family protein [Streptomyces]|uniref:LCP family protein n=1 Tax=Streptomyces TaxID=1883 RepID=UPI000C27D77D|nr:LCP family protein [Streptomyces sp. CB01201]MBX7469137.1 LCP family protein [Streptomyces sp. MAG02]PJN03834.1 transcriptional regulator [Streptomyces sp. CB01201]
MAGSHKAGAASRRESGGSAAPQRRNKRSRARIAGVTGLSVVVLAVAGGGWIYFQLNGNIKTFDDGGISADRPAASTKGSNVLIIGSDTRSGDNAQYGHGKGDIGRSDTALLLHVYSDQKHAVAVSIPRDSLVDIPPCKLPSGSWTKEKHKVMFNSAFEVGETVQGNPACTQNTVEKLTGLRVDHTMVMDFAGFARMTEAVGGVDVCVPNNVYQGDLNPNLGHKGSLVFAKGPQSVSGQKALDYVRIRHGIGDGSDIGRIQRQQAFIGSLIKKVKGNGLDPTTLLPLANAATKSMTVDSGLGSPSKLISFAMSMKDIDLHNTKFVTLPWRYEGARVAVVKPEADALFAALRADRTVDGQNASGKSASASPSPSAAAPEPASGKGISVAVYNGTVTKGLAAQVADSLRSAGFTVTGATTAATQDYTHTVIEYGANDEAKAKTVATHFPGALLRQAKAPGLNVIVGTQYKADGADGADAASSAPAAVPSAVADKARSADDNICSNLSYG